MICIYFMIRFANEPEVITSPQTPTDAQLPRYQRDSSARRIRHVVTQ